MALGYLANSFDLINVRDIDIIRQAGRYCSRLVLGVFSDEFAERQCGRPPIVPVDERVALVSHVRGVHQVLVHDGQAPPLTPGAIYFSVLGDPPLSLPAEPWLLQSTRHTASAVLRETLQPSRQTAATGSRATTPRRRASVA
jgi:hypothetical protein